MQLRVQFGQPKLGNKAVVNLRWWISGQHREMMTSIQGLDVYLGASRLGKTSQTVLGYRSTFPHVNPLTHQPSVNNAIVISDVDSPQAGQLLAEYKFRWTRQRLVRYGGVLQFLNIPCKYLN